MPSWIIPFSRVFYAIGLIGIGIQHFLFAAFMPVILPAWPPWIPGGPAWPYVVGAALISAGAAIMFSSRARPVAAVTGLVFLFFVLLVHVPVQLAAGPAHLGVWTNAFKELTLCGGAWVVARSLKESAPRLPLLLERVMPAGALFLPVTVIVFGIAHFVYRDFVATLVPAWIPGHIFWTYFAGVALIAAGAGMLLRIQGRLAAILLGVMIFLWLLILHIPRAIADPSSGKGNEWTSVFEALAFSGIAFLQAAQTPSKRAL